MFSWLRKIYARWTANHSLSLGDENMMPQLSEASRRRMDPTKVPNALHPLIPIAQRWGAVTSDTERYEIGSAATDEDIEALVSFAKSWSQEADKAFDEWSRKTKLSESYEFAKFDFLLMLLDGLDIKLPSYRGNPIDEAISRLQTTDGIGAKAGRMWAARRLAERGPEAKTALPALRQATTDSEPHVRAWAHAAIALIDGSAVESREAIRAILNEPIADSMDRMFAESALEELDRPDDERALRRLMGAAITNDVSTIRTLAKTLDVNLADTQDNDTAISLAVGGNHPEAVLALLEAGADPNQRDRSGNATLLQHAVFGVAEQQSFVYSSNTALTRS